LRGQGIDCSGWDPEFQPDTKLVDADIVNLGYVINVIENPAERASVVRRAWTLARDLLVVSAQVDSPPPEHVARPFVDGVLTTRDTFQKYFTQSELRVYLEDAVGVPAIAAAPGIFYLFKDETAKEDYLARRHRRANSVPKLRLSEARLEQNRALIESFIETIAQLGRLPDTSEFAQASELEGVFGSLRRAFAFVTRMIGSDAWTGIAATRSEDLLVYLALSRFGRRPAFNVLPASVQLDVKSFFGTYRRACALADDLLFTVGDLGKIDDACAQSSIGHLVDNALLVKRRDLTMISPLLRVYEGCARALCGEVEGCEIVKLHRYSGKVTYLALHEHEPTDRPRTATRVKVTLPTLGVDVFTYPDDESTPTFEFGEQLLAF